MTTTPFSSEVYYSGLYWNSYDEVVRHLNRRAYGSEDGNWLQFVRAQRDKPFQRALSLNCGNGWLERDLIKHQVVEQVVAVDYLEDLLASARDASTGMPIEYVCMDTNLAQFPDGPFDVIVNHAAGHHIAFVDRVFRRAAELLPADGRLLTWDYTGPHRNQYDDHIWRCAHDVNDMLPAKYRSPLSYPHLPTMLALDPTEAIHSELLLETMDRYFETEHFRRLGGAVAYLLLTHNAALFDAPVGERDEIVRFILDHDDLHLQAYPDESLFTFGISRPRSFDEISPTQLEIWSRAEAERERSAEANGGHYYLPTSVALHEYPPPAEEVVVLPPPSAYEVAQRGVRFTASAFGRALAMRVPGAVWIGHRAHRIYSRLRHQR